MKRKEFALMSSLLFAASSSWAQDKPSVSSVEDHIENNDRLRYINGVKKSREERLQSELYESTEWMPDSGVKLLGTKSTYRIWKEFHDEKKCRIPSLDIEKSNDEGVVNHFVLFQTEKLNIFVYEYSMNPEPGAHWTICDRDTRRFLFDSYFGNPISLYFDGDFPDGGFGGCPAPVSKVRFRKYTRNGPLLLEVLSQRCQDEPNYHESLFHIDTEFKEVPGSRVDMDYVKHPKRSWRWWYHGTSYEPRTLTFNEHGDAVWTRKLYKLPYKKNGARYAPKYKFSALVERRCIYDSDHREVECAEEELKP